MLCGEFLKLSCLPQTNLYNNGLTGKNNEPIIRFSEIWAEEWKHRLQIFIQRQFNQTVSQIPQHHQAQ